MVVVCLLFEENYERLLWHVFGLKRMFVVVVVAVEVSLKVEVQENWCSQSLCSYDCYKSGIEAHRSVQSMDWQKRHL